MDEDKTRTSVSTDKPSASLRSRVLGPSAFLTLEHVGYFFLVVLLPVMLISGFMSAVTLWSESSSSSYNAVDLLLSVTSSIGTTTAIMTSAALVVLMPLMYILRRRVSSEYAKRPDYTERVAYKLPVYTALGALAALTVGSFVGMVNVSLNSLVNIGVSGVNIGDMYISQFLPALLSFAVFGASAGYVALFAKGKDISKMFIGLAGLLSAVLVVALFITALTINHQTSSGSNIKIQPYPDYSDYFDY